MSYFRSAVKAFIKRPGFRTLSDSIRYRPSWRRYNELGRSPLVDQLPWMAFGAIDFLRQYLQPGMRLFEYGSGGSTLFWAARAGSVVSVEHDRQWYSDVRGKIADAGIEFLLTEPQPDAGFARKSFKNPDDYISHDQHYDGKNFEAYARTIDRYPEKGFDVIVVDGRARPSCIKHAIPRLKKGGLLVIDNTERTFYLTPFSWDKTHWAKRVFYGPVPYSRPFFETTIFIRLS